MNQQIVEYLQTNRSQYTKESLVAQLRNAGHGENDINEAIHVVYGDVSGIPVKEHTVKYAGFWIRYVAALVDGIILGLVSVPLGFIMGIGLSATVGVDNASAIGGILPRVIGFCIVSAYYIFMTHKYQATIGKKLVGIEVRASDSVEKATLSKIILRETIGKILSAVTIYIGYIMAGFTSKKQALHDMIGSTVVVYKDSQKKTNTAVIVIVVIVVIFVMIAIIGIFASIVLVSLNSARDKAQEASFKSTVSSTVPMAILCMEEEQNILPPSEYAKMCTMEDGEEFIWPMLDETGVWGQLIDGNAADGTFAYTANLPASGLTATCTQLGCEFSDDSTY